MRQQIDEMFGPSIEHNIGRCRVQKLHSSMHQCFRESGVVPSSQRSTIGASCMRYVQPPNELLREVSAIAECDQQNLLAIYCSDQRLLRGFFWFRLQLMTWLIRRVRPNTIACLDFGCGSGIFAASLATGF